MSGILEKLHLKHGNTNTPGGAPQQMGQQQMGQQQFAGQQQMGQQQFMGQQQMGQQQFAQTGVPMLGQQQMAGQQQFVQQGMMGVQHETIVKPAIVQQTVRTDRIVEVQPVIHKEIDQTIVHHVEKHITEAPAPNRGGVIQMQPVIQETVVRHEIDEVQPVIHREIATTQVDRVEEHRSERIVAPTQHTNQVTHENAMAQWGQFYPGQSFPMGQHGYPRLTREQKASRFEQKAQQYEQRGDTRKAQKNREKALRHRQSSTPGYVAQPRPQNYYPEKLRRLQQQQQMYQTNGNSLKAQRAQQRSDRLRQKHSL